MAYPVSYRRSAGGGAGFQGRTARDFSKKIRLPKPSNDDWRPPANDNVRRVPPRIPRGAGAALKRAGRLSPAYRLFQNFKTAAEIMQMLGEVPAGYEVPGDWTLCKAYSACSVVPDGHYWASGSTCNNAVSTACLSGQATLQALPGTTPSAPPSTNRDQKIIFVRKTKGDWGMSGFRCTWTRMYVRPSIPAVGDPAPYYREAQDPLYWPEHIFEGQPMLDPEALPIGQTVPVPQALPWALAAQRQPNPWRSSAYQSQWGYGPARAPRIEDVSMGRIISVDPSGRVDVRPTTRPHLRVKPARSRTTIERKVYLRSAGKASRLYRVANIGLGTVTEALDFLGVLYDLVPQQAKTDYVSRHVVRGTKLDIYDIMYMVATNIGDIDVAQAIVNYGKMQLEDIAWAKYGQLVAKSTPVGGTGVHDQVTEFLDIKMPKVLPSDWSARYERLEQQLVNQIRRVI